MNDSEQVKMDCECSFKLKNNKIIFDINNLNCINFNCEKTYKLFERGLNTGVFQLESYLGRKYSKRLRPSSIEHLTALGTLLRPGALQNVDENGVSTTEHFCLRKNGEEKYKAYHPILEDILGNTYHLLCYQEQSINIAIKIAGFTPSQGDDLRKSIGKKLPEEMAKVKKMFLEGVKKTKTVTEQQGEEIFSWIEKSQRYSFNRSHAYSYGVLGYLCQYLKAHFPLQFYTSWLNFAKEKQNPQEEIKSLVNEAKLFNIEVKSPSILNVKKQFNILNDNVINFGFMDIKGVGEKQVKKIKNIGEDIKEKENLTWFEFLTIYSSGLDKDILQTIIKVGSLDCFGISRQRMLFEHDIWGKLTPKEQQWIVDRKDNFKDLISSLKEAVPTKRNGGGTSNYNRSELVNSLIKLLSNPPINLEDNLQWVNDQEKEYLGITLSKQLTQSNSFDYDSCRQFIENAKDSFVLSVIIEKVNEKTIKNGPNTGKLMASLIVSDQTACLENVLIFADNYNKYKEFLYEGNAIAISGKKAYNNKECLVVNSVSQN